MSEIGQILRGLNGPALIAGHTGFKDTWLCSMLEQSVVSAQRSRETEIWQILKKIDA